MEVSIVPDSSVNEMAFDPGFNYLEQALQLCSSSVVVEVVNHKSADEIYESDSDMILIWCNVVFDLQSHMISRLQSQTSKPVIVYLSEYDEVSELVSLRSDALDVLHSKMSCNVIAERIMAVHRRKRGLGVTPASCGANQQKVEHSSCWLDIQTNELWFEEQKIEFTTREIKILEVLISKYGGMVTRNELISAIQSPGEDKISLRIIDSHVKRIRQKIKSKFDNFTPIKSVYGHGYKLVVPISLVKSRSTRGLIFTPAWGKHHQEIA